MIFPSEHLSNHEAR